MGALARIEQGPSLLELVTGTVEERPVKPVYPTAYPEIARLESEIAELKRMISELKAKPTVPKEEIKPMERGLEAVEKMMPYVKKGAEVVVPVAEKAFKTFLEDMLRGAKILAERVKEAYEKARREALERKKREEKALKKAYEELVKKKKARAEEVLAKVVPVSKEEVEIVPVEKKG